jgi:hypothetical protein
MPALSRRTAVALGVAALALFVAAGFLSRYEHGRNPHSNENEPPRWSIAPEANPSAKPQVAASADSQPAPSPVSKPAASAAALGWTVAEYEKWMRDEQRARIQPAEVEKLDRQDALGRPGSKKLRPAHPVKLTPFPLASSPLPELPCEIRFVQNGEDLKPPERTTGHGIITVNNGTPQDAIVKVVPESTPKESARFVYVSAGKQVDIGKLDQGNYAVWFCQGGGLAPNWCSDRQQFRDYHRCARFEQPLDFREEKRENTQFWDHHTLTLHKVPGGNARTVPVSRSSFDEIK